MFPLLREVGLHAYSTGGDGYSSAAVYTPLRGSPGIAEKVYGWSVPSSKEPHGEGRDNIVITDVELLAPPDFPVGPYDLVDLLTASTKSSGNRRTTTTARSRTPPAFG